jgi:hypothetical protein
LPTGRGRFSLCPQLVAQGPQADSQEARGVGAVAVHPPQGLGDGQLFELAQIDG